MPLLGVREEVAGVRVAVEEAVDEDLLDDRPDERAPELVRSKPASRSAATLLILIPRTNSIVSTRDPDSSS